MTRLKITVSNLETQEVWADFFEQPTGEWLDDDGETVVENDEHISDFLYDELINARAYFNNRPPIEKKK